MALALGSILAAVVGWVGWHYTRPAVAPADFDREAIAELLARRSTEKPVPVVRAPGTALRAEDRAWYVPIEDAKKLFAVLMRGSRYDPWCYHSHKPNLRLEVQWAEHPRHQWTYRTNSIGLREDDEVRSEQPDLRVLVTGDSHSDGFCDNADSYSNRLEASLARRFPKTSVEVLNAADLAYSFYSYLGVLEKFLYLKPNVFVVAVHGGNDFQEVLLPYRYFARLPLPQALIDDGKRVHAAGKDEIFVPASYQGLLSIAYFRHHPEEKAVALRAAVQVFSEMKRTCTENGIVLICVYLPSPIEIERNRLSDIILPSMRALGLQDGDIETHAEIGRTLMREIAAMGIVVLDTTAALHDAAGPCFWRQDLHLNLIGHETIARSLEPLVAHLAGLHD
jgi:hypothetical protein